MGNANNLQNYLLSRQGRYVVDVDLDIRTSPIVSAILPFLSFSRYSFDLVLSFQLLEHMPFSIIFDCLREFKSVRKKYFVISLPDMSLSKRNKVKFYIYKYIKHPREWNIYHIRNRDKVHFWEIGYGDINLGCLEEKIFLANLVIMSHFRNNLFPYHHFFVLKIKGD